MATVPRRPSRPPTLPGVTNAARRRDEISLESALGNLLDVDMTSWDTYEADPIVNALTHAGVFTFNSGLLVLREEDILSLKTTKTVGADTIVEDLSALNK